MIESPIYDHIVIVVEENHSAYQITDDYAFFDFLLAKGASFANMFAITHPSQPNYIALFSGSTQGITDNGHYSVSATCLYHSLVAAGRTFCGYSEDLPYSGYTGDTSGAYVRKHAPWVTFATVSPEFNQPFSMFPKDYQKLPTVSFVIPNLNNDMHDGTIAQADRWLNENIKSYAFWAQNNNSLLIVTFDEPYRRESPQHSPVATYFMGAGIIPGYRVETSCTLYSILRYIEDLYGMPYLGEESDAQELKDSGISSYNLDS